MSTSYWPACGCSPAASPPSGDPVLDAGAVAHFLALALLVVGGCASTPPADSTGALAGVRVPDAFTPLTVEPISGPTFPFQGTDQKFHLAFDVQLTNATAVPARLDKVDVIDARDPSRVLVSFTGPQLVYPACA